MDTDRILFFFCITIGHFGQCLRRSDTNGNRNTFSQPNTFLYFPANSFDFRYWNELNYCKSSSRIILEIWKAAPNFWNHSKDRKNNRSKKKLAASVDSAITDKIDRFNRRNPMHCLLLFRMRILSKKLLQ